MATPNAVYSSMVRAGRTTYFVDVKEAKNGKRYMSISENRLDEDDKKQRITVRVFKESVDQFRQAVEEASKAVVV
ncbi:MAG: hypothetical protein H6Q31_265 [Bacteroidetes bacterium]|jgi:hypothetical protein|nr:hypothetical protein [Bacteroidota bacterium]